MINRQQKEQWTSYLLQDSFLAWEASKDDNACQQSSLQVVSPASLPMAVTGAVVTSEQSKTHRQPMPKLQRYNREVPTDTYLMQVQLAAQLNGWTAEEIVGHVALSLEGKALQILTDLQPEEL